MGAFLVALPAFIAALPALLQVLAKFMGLAVKFAEYAEKQETKKWLENVESTFDELAAAKTSEAKFGAAKRLNDVFRSLG